LTRLNRQILNGHDLALAPCDNPKRPGVGQLLHVRAMLECAGLSQAQRATVSPHGRRQVPPANEPPPAVDFIYFDATARRRERMRRAGQDAAAITGTRPPASLPPAAPLESFVVKLVCGQT